MINTKIYVNKSENEVFHKKIGAATTNSNIYVNINEHCMSYIYPIKLPTKLWPTSYGKEGMS